MRGAASAINLLPCYIVALFDVADTAVHESEAYRHSSLCYEKKNSQIHKQKTTDNFFLQC